MAFGAISESAHGPGLDTGRSYVTARAASARTKGDVVRLSATANGLVDISLADDTSVWFTGVAAQDIASGTRGLYQVTGRCTITTPSITTTAGNGIDIVDGAMRDSTTTAEVPNGVTTNNDIAVTLTAATTSTTQDVYLYGNPTTGQT